MSVNVTNENNNNNNNFNQSKISYKTPKSNFLSNKNLSRNIKTSTKTKNKNDFNTINTSTLKSFQLESKKIKKHNNSISLLSTEQSLKHTNSKRKKILLIPSNSISVSDRTKIRNTPLKRLNLGFLEQNQKKNNSNANFINTDININNDDININSFQRAIKYKKTFYAQKNLELLNENNAFSNSNYKFHKKNKSNIINNRRYSLQHLMALNPYHLVKKKVLYNPIINCKIISNQLNDLKSNIFPNNKNKIILKKNKKLTNNNLIDKNYSNNIINNKNKFLLSCTFKLNNRKKEDLLWRILSIFSKMNLSMNVKQIFIYEGFRQLWYQYAILIEKLLINYKNFKWFLEKDKFITESIFSEFINLIENNYNLESKKFSHKIFLLLDNNNSGYLNIKKFFFFMEFTSDNNSMDFEQIEFIIDLFEDVHKKNEEKNINITEFLEIFKYLINNDDFKKYYKEIKNSIKKFFLNEKINDFYNNNENFYVTKQEFYDWFSENKLIIFIIKRFKFVYKNSRDNFKDEINSLFNENIGKLKLLLNAKDINEYDLLTFENFKKILVAMHEKIKKINLLQKIFDENNI